MRTPLILGFVALLVPACMDGITGVGDDDDTSGGAVCGNGAMDTGEACDDGNTANGDGCSSSCQTENLNVPRVAISVDKATLDTELRTTNQLVVTVQSVNGFLGDVNLTASALNGAAPIDGWSATLDTPTVTLAADATATAKLTLTIPSANKGLMGTVKIDGASSAAPASAMTAVTVANQVTFKMKVANNACVYPLSYGKVNNMDDLSVGTKIRWFNEGTTGNFEIHTNGAAGVSHQGRAPNGLADPTTEPNTAYEQTVGASGATIEWYCHVPAEVNMANYGYFNTL